MTVLCTYVVTQDTGLGPNPFGRFCTLAVCTPNRQRADVRAGDWIAGFSPKADGNRLIHAMQLCERIHMNDYFHDPRFASKKPNLRGTWQERCGDNFYGQGTDGTWCQHRNRFHIGPEYLAKDTRHPFVFVAELFWYFGSAAPQVPRQFAGLVGLRGIRVKHPQRLVHGFITRLQSSYKPGIHARPSHNLDAA